MADEVYNFHGFKDSQYLIKNKKILYRLSFHPDAGSLHFSAAMI